MKKSKRFWSSVFLGNILFFIGIYILGSEGYAIPIVFSSLVTGFVSQEKGWFSAGVMILISTLMPVVIFSILALIASIFSHNIVEGLKYMLTLFTTNQYFITIIISVLVGGLSGVFGEYLYKIIKS